LRSGPARRCHALPPASRSLKRESVTIRGTYCDLAVRIDGALALLIEAKAIGLELKDAFVKQAVDYAANQGVEWVVLTNAIVWRANKVNFGKPHRA